MSLNQTVRRIDKLSRASGDELPSIWVTRTDDGDLILWRDGHALKKHLDEQKRNQSENKPD